jgi:hypothetical protein
MGAQNPRTGPSNSHRRDGTPLLGALLSDVSLGNLFTSLVNFLIQDAQGNSRRAGPDYYLFFATAMLLTAIAFVPKAIRYPERAYLQTEAPDTSPSAG